MEFVKYIPGILIILVAAAFISVMWVNGVFKIMNDCPDYKGDDLFRLDEDDKTQIG
jgi:hypothetical protein